MLFNLPNNKINGCLYFFAIFKLFGSTENGQSWPFAIRLMKSHGGAVHLFFWRKRLMDQPGPAKTGQDRPFSVPPKAALTQISPAWPTDFTDYQLSSIFPLVFLISRNQSDLPISWRHNFETQRPEQFKCLGNRRFRMSAKISAPCNDNTAYAKHALVNGEVHIFGGNTDYRKVFFTFKNRF